MAVTRIVANLRAENPARIADFYRRVFGLHLALDMGWITFLEGDSQQKVEMHAASQGGNGTDVPVISIGVDDLEGCEEAIRAAGAEIVYGPVKEEWGLRRFFFRDPAGNVVNVVDSLMTVLRSGQIVRQRPHWVVSGMAPSEAQSPEAD